MKHMLAVILIGAFALPAAAQQRGESPDRDARREVCRAEARGIFKAGKASQGRGGTPDRDQVRQYVRACMQRGR